MTREEMQQRLSFLVEEFKPYDFIIKAEFATDAELQAFRAEHRAELERAKVIKEEMIRLRWALLSPEDQKKARDLTRGPQ